MRVAKANSKMMGKFPGLQVRETLRYVWVIVLITVDTRHRRRQESCFLQGTGKMRRAASNWAWKAEPGAPVTGLVPSGPPQREKTGLETTSQKEGSDASGYLRLENTGALRGSR